MNQSKFAQIKKKLKSDDNLTVKDQMKVKGGGVVFIPILGINGGGNLPFQGGN